MTVTDDLYRVFLIDNQIRGLRSRLDAAEKFLAEQERQLKALAAKRQATEAQLRQLKASSSNNEGEVGRLDAQIAELRERMNSAKSNKEYQALLNEINTHKTKRGGFEEQTLGQIETIEKLSAQLSEIDTQQAERSRVRDVAAQQRKERSDEIAGKLSELEATRAERAAGVPADVMDVYRQVIAERDDDALAPIEIHDRKRHEFHCGGCMMALPVESMSGLLSHGRLTRCPSCGVILYVEESARERMAAKR
jgi:Zn-ribbon protein, possibly nucleic acid-binding